MSILMRFKLLTINVSEEFSPFKNFKTTTSAHKLVIQLKRRKKNQHENSQQARLLPARICGEN